MGEHVVVIATIGRPQLQRALCSVRAQVRGPDRVIVCVDGSPQRKGKVERAVQRRDRPFEVMCNDRTRGAAGTWNTALDRIARKATDPGAIMVSFLDDDDWWETTHLGEVDAAAERGAEVVATTIVRHDGASPDGAVIEPPAALVHGDFLRGNPGIQGSNLSVRLSTLLEAGMFDEALRSCTDRDICIRLADLGARYEGVRSGRIHHDARRRGRLSTPGSQAKRDGLDTFHAKHAWRMTRAEESACLERGRKLFGWTPSVPPEREPSARREARTSERMTWVVAVIIDSAEPARALPFIDDVARLAAHPRVAELALVLLQNGPAEGFAHVTRHAGAADLEVRAIAEEEQRHLGAELGLTVDELSGKKSIAVARSMLQQVAHRVARAHTASVVWVADDDLRLPEDLDLLVDDVTHARATGMSAAIGMVAGAPPVPAATTLRTQLVDLVSFLRGAAVRAPEDPVPDAARHNARWQHDRRDYYYDLVRRQTDRLETPFLPDIGAADLGTLVAEVATRTTRILAGEQIFRPVRPADGDPLAALPGPASGADDAHGAQPTLVRGGNTFVFDVDLLRDVPNLAPRVAGRRLRRSDTLWALLARFQAGKEIHLLPIVALHDRSHERARGFEPDKLFDDVLGYAFSRAFEEYLKWEHPLGAPVRLSPAARGKIVKRAHKLARERTAELRLSCFRVRGLARALDHLLDTTPRPCGLDGEGEAALRDLAQTLRRELSEPAFRELDRRIQDVVKDRGFEAYFDAVAQHERLARARRCCEQRLGLRVDEALGAGSEGVVLRAGDRVLKVLDAWSDEDRARHLATLRALAERPAPGALPRVVAVHDDGHPVIVEMVWEPSVPYTGGRGPEMVALLRALRAAGWAHSNVRPDNLRVTADGLRIIDVGRSLQPFSEEAEEHVARRALLSMRGAGRPDLADLMRRSIHDAALPELRGVEHLLRAVRDEDAKVSLDEAVTRAAERHLPGAVLDFGCGKPRAFLRRMGRGSFTAFDPDGTLVARWERDASDIPFLDEPGLLRRLESGPRFDVILCSLVLCSLDGGEVAGALARMRGLVQDGGVVIVAVCDPRAVDVEHTTRHTRFLPRDASYEGSFCYVKQVAGASTRVEHHRPLSAYRGAFFDAGFQVVAESTLDGVDTDRLTRAGEFVIFELRPRPARSDRGGTPHAPRGRSGAPSPAGGLAGLTVLSYHRVAEEPHRDPAIALHRARGMVVSRGVFERQMCALGRLFQPVRPEDVRRAATGRGALPRHAVWITFDDGYRDVAAAIAPVLEKERIPATFFVRAPGEDGLPSWAPLDLAYQALARAAIPDARAQVPQGEERERLLSTPYLEQMRWATSLAAREGALPGGIRREDLYLSGREIDDLRSPLFSIGAHGIDHVRWTTLDDDALSRAATTSIDWLDRVAPGEPRCVAYPDAAIDTRVATASARAGFALGVVLEAPAPGGVEPRLAVRRRIAQDDEAWIEALSKELEDR